MLGLLVATDARWAGRAVAEIERLVADHAHCEMKAASNALAMAGRCVDQTSVLRALTEIAEEEIRHFRRVLSVLEARRIPLGPPEEDWYAAELRRRVTKDPANVFVTRLLIASVIEARSCERFKLLAAALAGVDAELSAFYGELVADEARHHRLFVDLALAVNADAAFVRERQRHVAQVEATIVAELGSTATIHG